MIQSLWNHYEIYEIIFVRGDPMYMGARMRSPSAPVFVFDSWDKWTYSGFQTEDLAPYRHRGVPTVESAAMVIDAGLGVNIKVENIASVHRMTR